MKPVPTSGGIERVTDIIALGLSKYSHKCFVLYDKDVVGTCNDCFISSSLIPTKERIAFIKNYLCKNEIDIVVVQGRRDVLSSFKQCINGLSIKLVYVLHSDPGYGFDTFNVDTLKYEILHTSGFLRLHKLFILALYPLYKLRCKKILKLSYQQAYSIVDKFILLSDAAVPYFIKLANITDVSKISVINNPMTYDKILPITEYSKKEKIVLIVSRMEEHSKKLSLALKAWKKIERDKSMNQWILEIVGDGEDLNAYKQWVVKNGLRRVRFYGTQVPDKFYKKSSIFLMTSKSEAWGMTIIEAQQQMCVPVAFNSYCAIKDIIKHKRNGLLVDYPSVNDFSSSICELASNYELRKRMAFNGRSSTKAFSHRLIIKKWNSLLNKTISNQ